MASQKSALIWGHININVSDLDRSVAFYEKLGFTMAIPGIPYLGLSADEKAQTLNPSGAIALDVLAGTQGRACIMQLDDGFPKLDLTQWNAGEAKKPLCNNDKGIVRICLGTPDLKSTYESLVGDGVEFLSTPQQDQNRLADVAVCVDPDGTLIELIEIHFENWGPFIGNS